MSVLTNQTSVNPNRSFFELYGQSSSVPQNIVCSTINSVVSINTPLVETTALNYVTSINGTGFAHSGVGCPLDTGITLDGNSGYRGNNAFFDVTSTNPANTLALDLNAGGTVGGNWVQVAQEPGNASYAIRADNIVNPGLNYTTIEVIQGSDTTSRLYVYSGGNGESQTGWHRVAGHYTKELTNGGFSNLLTGYQTFTMPNTYVTASNLNYRVTANGRIQLNSGTPTAFDSVGLRIGMNNNVPPNVCGTTIPMGLSNVTNYDFSIAGTIYDNSANLPINTIFVQTNQASNAVYELYVDSFTVSQV